MKKLLCGLLCASAVLPAVAVDVEVANIDVIEIDSGLKNTIVAIPGLDLAGGDLVISNLVKTTNLKQGDKLVAFSDGKYESWELDADGGHWTQAASRFLITANGTTSSDATPASLVRMSVGSGIWLQRSASGTGNPFYVYAAHVDSPTTTVSANATVLLGNPTVTDKTPTISGMQNGDQIIVPNNTAFPTYYTYVVENEDGAWKYIDSSDALQTGLPTITAGTGFWYKAANAGSLRTMSW